MQVLNYIVLLMMLLSRLKFNGHLLLNEAG